MICLANCTKYKLYKLHVYLMFAVCYSYANKLKRSAEGKGGGHMKSPMPDGDFRLNEMITEDMVADAYDRKTSCQLRFQQTSVEVRHYKTVIPNMRIAP